MDYLSKALWERRNSYHKMTFSMDYFPQGRYLLPYTHDETGGRDGNYLVERMYGRTEKEKYANARLFFLFMYAHPGKKLLFMGNEMGIFRKWRAQYAINWKEVTNRKYQMFRRFIKDVNHIYLASPSLYASDYDSGGFWRIERHRPEDGVIAFGRNGWECVD